MKKIIAVVTSFLAVVACQQTDPCGILAQRAPETYQCVQSIRSQVTAPIWVDSLGQIVGPVINGTTPVYIDQLGIYWTLDVNADIQLPLSMDTVDIGFKTNDCTGLTYIKDVGNPRNVALKKVDTHYFAIPISANSTIQQEIKSILHVADMTCNTISQPQGGQKWISISEIHPPIKFTGPLYIKN